MSLALGQVASSLRFRYFYKLLKAFSFGSDRVCGAQRLLISGTQYFLSLRERPIGGKYTE